MLTVADSLRPLVAFAAVAEERSFTRAAERLGMTKAGVSKLVQRLEEQLGAQLLTRTTRRVTLTDAGHAVLEPAQRMRAAAEVACAVAQPHQETPTGKLTVASPVGFGQRVVAPLLGSFAERHPELAVELVLDDAMRPLVEDGVDLAIRGGRQRDSSLVCRKLCPLPLLICASPKYLARHGTPRAPQALGEHEWLGYSPLGGPAKVRMRVEGRTRAIAVSGRLRTNDGDVLRQWLVAGLGVSLMPSFWVESDVAAGRLRVLLRDTPVAPVAMWAVHPHGRRPPMKVRAFIEHLHSALATRA